MQSETIFDFNKTSNTTNWKIVDDVVMGGKSSGSFNLGEDGNGVFEGHVSLENNGGFSTVKYSFNTVRTKGFSKISFKVRGDGKSYQFRIKSKSSNKYAYINYFNSTKGWETFTITLSEMYPTFKGRKLDMPNYDQDGIEEIAFLIGNKKAEDFKLEIESIVLS
ncbi:CIA30 family protein [Formosa sp. PL04]|uniref:CIA30 family protein n=1 Tax=Formosa sp. PL04 TaxID=3081755 RepID=UPI0029811FF7|nr:CIA30 family protein [Formosa sp. PL04]MDW5290872.1 CIA30 family protein [Formosa sp. PL04]